ncbi:MAG: molybdate transporter substrate-binding protein [Pseudomonadota bacterium]
MCLAAFTPYSAPAWAADIKIAAASDLKFAMDAIVPLFKADHPNTKVEVVYGSSGRFFNQIQQGAPFDLYFSADVEYPRQLIAAGYAHAPVRLYGIGRIVLFSLKQSVREMRLEQLGTMKHINKIAIANPKHAPYGKRAVEALQAAGVYSQVESKLVFGENISQTAQFVHTGNADMGIIALSLVLNPALSAQGRYVLIPSHLHQPLAQGFVLTRKGMQNPKAVAFGNYMEQAQARAIMTQYGFSLPQP